MAEYFTMSYFGARYFLLNYVDSDTVPTSATEDDEITSVLTCNIGAFTKENTKYRTLNSNGWETIATLGNTADDGTFECVREGTGGVYNGTAGSTTYTRIKDWFMKATAGAGKEAPKCIVEVVPRGDSASQEYEGTCYFVVPSKWTPGTRDTQTGQEYSFTVSPFGPPIPITVTKGEGTWTFAKAGAGA